MVDPLLRTRLAIPLPHEGIVERPQLYEQLAEGLASKLTLISAPAGFGKTTLLVAWVEQLKLPAAWLTLDESDNNPASFQQYLVAALQTIDSQIGERAQVMLQAVPAPAMESLLISLINDIIDHAPPFTLVLDDYHLITAEEVHRGMAFLLEHMPPALHVVIATRADPPLPLARLRARRQIVELREDDLRFSPDEAAAFLNQVMALGLTLQEAESLSRRSEGWIAGLQMAGLSLAAREDKASFIADFSGSHEFIVDYLTDEVLNRQPESLTAFLLQTSILKQMSGPLCDAVTGGSDGQKTLEALRKTNLFILPLDVERRWYRYHRLFADLLRQRLHLLRPDSIPDLHRRASQWYAENDLVPDAIHHALEAGDHEWAADLIESLFDRESTWSHLKLASLENWLAALPEAVMVDRPRLRLFRARTLTVRGELVAAHRVLEALEAELRPIRSQTAETAKLYEQIVADLTSNAVLEGHVDQARTLASRALAELAEDDLTGQMRQSAILALAAFRLGDIATAHTATQEAIAQARALGFTIAEASLEAGLAQAQAAGGALTQAIETCNHALELATVEGRSTPAVGPIALTKARLLYERNDLADAAALLQMAMAGVKVHGPFHSLIETYASLARVQQAQGQRDSAETAIQQAVQLTEGHAYGHLVTLIPAIQARLWLARGEHDLAARWAEHYRSSGATEYLREFEDLTLIRVMLANNQLEEALLLLLESLFERAESGARVASLIEIHLLHALTLEQTGSHDDALASLAEALVMAEPEGYVRVFLDEGESAARLLYEAAAEGIYPEFVGQLLAAFPLPAPEASAGDDPLIEPLSERELEVLELLAEGLSNREVGQRLVISLPTVKTHTSNIYSKLEVKGRMQAVKRARQLGILPPL